MSIQDTIRFIRQKDYRFIKNIGQGGTGKTILIKDETINEEFVCKKYDTFYNEHQQLYYQNFIEEIKILHKIFHPNIVRVFNYFLYPEVYTGYILMEHIEGQTADIYLLQNPDKLEDIFLQMIAGFRYLEEKQILHRDIRSENILVSEIGILKIIDFGFGKLQAFDGNDKSITLNWAHSIPDDFREGIYDFTTEVYFVGKFFESILQNLTNVSFKYLSILTQMVNKNRRERIISFFEVYRETLKVENTDFVAEFTDVDKYIYRNFANELVSSIRNLSRDGKYQNNLESINRELEQLYNNSVLEVVIQNNSRLIDIFFQGSYSYYNKKEIYVSSLKEILDLFKRTTENKQKVILNNLWGRLDSIQRKSETDELPF